MRCARCLSEAAGFADLGVEERMAASGQGVLAAHSGVPRTEIRCFFVVQLIAKTVSTLLNQVVQYLQPIPASAF